MIIRGLDNYMEAENEVVINGNTYFLNILKRTSIKSNSTLCSTPWNLIFK